MIKAPRWCGDAIPVASKGWVSPSGELLVSSRFTQAQVDEWYGNSTTVDTTAEEDVDEILHDMITEGKIQATMENYAAVAKDAMSYDHTEEDDLESMIKSELELLGREHGVELDRRKTKATLVSEMREVLSK